jgi:hypothetical protein
MKPADPIKLHRACELLGIGLTQPEAAGATGIGERTLRRAIAERPEYSRVVKETREARNTGAAAAAAVVRDLLEAVNHDGTPDYNRRKQGAELYARYPSILDADPTNVLEDKMLPGVKNILVFPWAGDPDPPDE